MRGDEGSADNAPVEGRTLAVFATTTVLAFALIWASSEMGRTADHDGHWYSMMARFGITEAVPAPFRNRPLSPWLASMLPGPWGFAVVTSIMLGIAVAALERFVRSLLGARMALVGIALLVSTAGVQMLVRVPFRVDAGTLAAACVVLVCLHERRWLLLVAVMPLATFNHEIALVLLVPILLTAWREKRLLDATLITLVSTAMWWVLHRSGTLPVNDRATFLAASEREQVVGWNIRMYGSVPGAIWRHFFTAFGAAGLIGWFGWTRAPRLLRDAALMVGPCAVLSLGATQWARVFGPVVPIVVALGCVALVRAVDGVPAVPSVVERDDA